VCPICFEGEHIVTIAEFMDERKKVELNERSAAQDLFPKSSVARAAGQDKGTVS
jgi:hypothetical protein